MKTHRITIALTDKLINDIDNRGDSRRETIERDLKNLYSMELFTLISELKGVFTKEELEFLASRCVQGLGYSFYSQPRVLLLNNIDAAIDPRSLKVLRNRVQKSDNDKLLNTIRQLRKVQSSLRKKIEKMTIFQCHCILRTIETAFHSSTNGLSIEDLSAMFNPVVIE